MTLVGSVLLVSILVYVTIAWNGARSDLAAELDAARQGGLQTVRSAFEDMPRSDHPARDLRQLVSTFDGNRHVQAAVLGNGGQVRFASHVALPRQAAPAWFAASLRPDIKLTRLPVPDGSGSVLVLRAEPASDVAALWSATFATVGLFAAAAVIGLGLIHWVIGRALEPLSDLARGLEAIGSGDYAGRVREAGPRELVGLQQGFNTMADRLAESDARNRALEVQLLTIQDEERAEIARDLHDEIGPHLFAVALDAEMISRSLASANVRAVPEQVRSIQSAVSFMQRQVRELIGRLRPTRAAELGLEAAIGDLVTFWQSRQPQVTFTTDLAGADDFTSEPLHDVIYRVVQEAVANALRHADTTELLIAVRAGGTGVIVEVANRGVGKDRPQDLPGLGLISMRERVHAAGGILQIERGDRGWTITVRFFPPGKVAT